jgi:Cof subfamily protein (haloacid dehalogenase superfamily)
MLYPVNPQNIQALALDLDGTVLAPGAVLTDRTLRVLTCLRERGIQLIIATGRALAAAEQFRVPLGAAGPMVYFNGAVVADTPGGRILDATLLAADVVDFCVDLSRRTGTYYQVYFPGSAEQSQAILMAERAGPERDMYHNHTGILAQLGDLKEVLREKGGCIKSMFLAEPDVQDRLRPQIEERFGSRVYITRTLRTFLEVMDPRVSKGEGLKRVLSYRGISPGAVIALGDEENDLPMFAVAGFSAAPANAKETVKAAASLVIGSNAEDGAAVWLEELFGL